MTFFTIGHSTHSTEAFLAALRSCEVAHLVDVRAMPGSRANPQFDLQALSQALAGDAITYQHVAALGGLRPRSRTVPADVNALWRNRSFHRYADHALSAEFETALERLRALACSGPVAVMCAEAVWWRCHRRVIADHLLHRGETVYHVLPDGELRPATLTPGAVADPGGRLVYPRGTS